MQNVNCTQGSSCIYKHLYVSNSLPVIIAVIFMTDILNIAYIK